MDTALILTPGLTVLYGLNGAGKTRLLTALYSVLLGQQVALDGSPIPEPVAVALFVRASDLAEVIRFEPPLDSPTGMWDFPGDPYRREDRAMINEAFLEAKETDLVALTPDSRPGRGWEAYRAVDPTPGSAVALLRDHDNAFLDLTRHLILEDDAQAAQVGSRWGFDPQVNVFLRIDGTASLHLKSYDPVVDVGLDAFADVPDDGLPLVLQNSNRAPWDGAALSLPHFNSADRVITNVGVHTVREASAEAIRLAMRGEFVTAEAGWGTYESHRDDASNRGREELILQVREEHPELEDWGEGITVTAGPMAPIERWHSFAADLADALLQRFLLDAPRVTATVSDDPGDVIAGDALRWHTVDGLPLESLSNAEQRWAVLAIRLALIATSSEGVYSSRLGRQIPTAHNLHLPEGTFLLLDEPEAALHRTAEQHMARGLASLARTPGLHVICASHSPHLMDAASATVHRVHRVQRQVVQEDGDELFRSILVTKVTPLDEVTRSDLSSLGLEPSELLRRQRLLLLVEGRHDELVIGHFLGEGLARTRGQIVPMRGASQLPWAMESRLLFDFTDATVVPVVDNVAGERISTVWEEAVVLAASEGSGAAGDYLRLALDPKAAIEHKFLGQFLSRAIECGCESRVQPFGLEKKDILFYLPVGFFTEQMSSWQDILDAHLQALSSGRTKITDWKKWATATLRARFDDDTIRDALKALDETPAEFLLLNSVCQSLVEGQP